jgi:hypothetical protein
MIVLDTNVLSSMMQDNPDPLITAWLAAQPRSLTWTTAISVFEIQHGLLIMAAGAKQRKLQALFDQAVRQDFSGRVLPFDSNAAIETAGIAAKLRSIGRPIDMRDAMIAGTVAAHGATLATRNTKHFVDAGIPLIDPWQSAGPTP